MPRKDIRWAILATAAVVSLIHLAAHKDKPMDPWEQFWTDLEAVLSAAAAGGA